VDVAAEDAPEDRLERELAFPGLDRQVEVSAVDAARDDLRDAIRPGRPAR